MSEVGSNGDRSAESRTARRGWSVSTRSGAVLGALCVLFVNLGCEDFVWNQMLDADKEGSSDGTTPTVLTIQPAAVVVATGGDYVFTASGGTPSYFFSIDSAGSGSPSIGGSSGIYTAGSSPGTDVVRVTDAAASSDTATVTVVPPPDYTVSAAGFPGYGSSSAAFTGDFTIQETAGNDGTTPIDWRLYISADETLDGGDVLADSGIESALTAGGSSAPVGFSGTWPAATDTYHYLIVLLNADDDSNPANDRYVSTAIPVPSVTFPGGTEAEPNGDPPPGGDYNELNVLSDTTMYRLTGTMDGSPGEYDTFRFTTGAGINRIELICTWSGADDIDLYFWDDATGAELDFSSEASSGREPGPGTNTFRVTGISSSTTYRIGVKFKTVSAGTYHLFIHPN